MAEYGDLSTVKMMLRPNETTVYGSDIDARLALIQKAISVRLEQELGWDRSDTTVTVYAGSGPVLMLPTPARSIASVTVAGTAYDAALWESYPVDVRGRILGLRLLSELNWGLFGAWGTPLIPVVIAGDFDIPNSGDAVPADVTYAANVLIQRTFQRENTGVAGVSGEDGFHPPLDPWKDPTVKGVIARYRVTQLASF